MHHTCSLEVKMPRSEVGGAAAAAFTKILLNGGQDGLLSGYPLPDNPLPPTTLVVLGGPSLHTTIVGVGLPVYSSFKAIETKNEAEKEEWLIYWSAYGCFSVAETFSDKLLSWCPFYYHAKLAFLVWLQIPNNWGAKHVYWQYIRPALVKHQAKIDGIVDRGRTEVVKLLSQNENELRAAGLFIHRTATSLYRSIHSNFPSPPPPPSPHPTAGSSPPHPRAASAGLGALAGTLLAANTAPGGSARVPECGEHTPILPMLSIPNGEGRSRTVDGVDDVSEREVWSPPGWVTVDAPLEADRGRGN